MDGIFSFQFVYAPRIFLAPTADPAKPELVGTATDAAGRTTELDPRLLDLIVDNCAHNQQLHLQRAFYGHRPATFECATRQGAFDRFYFYNTAKSAVFLGSSSTRRPSDAAWRKWKRENLARRVIGEKDFADFVRTGRFRFYVSAPNGALAQHGLALVHYLPAGRAWLETAGPRFAPWKTCTPKAQLTLRILKRPDKLLLQILRRYLRIPKTQEPFEMADLLRVVTLTLDDVSPATTLLNLFLAHFASAQ